MQQQTPFIYVACLASYNSGILYGANIDVTQDIDQIYSEIRSMLKNSPIPNAEEWAIHDYEDFGDIEIHEYESIEDVQKLAAFYQEHGDLGAKMYKQYFDIDEAEEALNDRYHGAWDSEVDFAIELFDSIYCSPEIEAVRCYIDYEKFARDLFQIGRAHV